MMQWGGDGAPKVANLGWQSKG